jgi:hypothetical protein
MDTYIVQYDKLEKEFERAATSLIQVYNERSEFFTDDFITKVRRGNRKALAKLRQFNMPPTPMDLRAELAKCVAVNVPPPYEFSMKDGRKFTTIQLKDLIPLWAQVAEEALIKSDPQLADKLMSQKQWNAKSAFEVIFTTALNDLKALKISDPNAKMSIDHYLKWTIKPLKDAIEQVKALRVPGNTLIGYGNKSPISEALVRAEKIEGEFHKMFRN